MTASHLTLITGASRGLGQAMAEQLLQAGHAVLGISRKQSPALAEEGQSRRRRAHAMGAGPVRPGGRRGAPVGLAEDAGRPALRQRHAHQQRRHRGQPAPLSGAVAAELSLALRIGLEAPMLLTAAFLGATREWRGARKVLNISSGLGRNAMGSQAPYCGSKAGMDHFSRAVALEEAHAPNGARIVSLAPGVIDTDMQVQLRGASAEKFPDRTRFEKMKNEGMLDSPATAAAKVLKYLARADFGANPVADVRDPA
jgi:benzil reductase ((S)-benzoin forming)